MTTKIKDSVILQLEQDNNALMEIYEHWIEKKRKEDDIHLLLWNISTFLMDCTMILNRGVMPNKPKKKLDKKSYKLLDGYIDFWSEALIMLRSQLPAPKFKKARYSRVDYHEPVDVIPVSVISKRTHYQEDTRVRIRSIYRDY